MQPQQMQLEEPNYDSHKEEVIAKSDFYAIKAVSLRKNFAKKGVLNNLSLRVPIGKIYGLLGPSGCGKTTLLKCVVGRLRPDSGIIHVLGQRPGKFGHKVPGRLVGYMPQDIALYQEFTIKETMFFFGRIFRMETSLINSQVDFMVSLLDLPDKERLIAQLSGGQQRRVSFACALLHEPPLLILDEPTVGVDPLLRQCIWHHLQKLVSNKEKPCSVVITTHYIEEARMGDLVALMRDGKLLAENNPMELMSRYNEATLEAVFLHLCHQQKPEAEISAAADNVEILRDPPITFVEQLRAGLKPPSIFRICVLAGKSVTNLRRRPTFLLFQLMLPIIQIVLFCLCIGADPHGIRIAVVNMDSGRGRVNLGDELLSYLDNKIFAFNMHQNLDSAKHQVQNANAWSVLHLSENFSISLTRRLLQPSTVSDGTITDSSLHLYMDNSNYQVSAVVRKSLMESYQSFIRNLVSTYNSSMIPSGSPLIVHPPLLGSADPSFTEFMAPGMLIQIVFFLSTGLTAMSFVVERKEGLLERSIVAGVTLGELMLGHMLIETVIMTCQTGILLIFCLGVFRVPCHGSVPLAFCLALLSGLTGTALGLLISVLCTAETAAIQAALGIVYPNLLLSGIVWPREGMPTLMRHVSTYLPSTLLVDAMRSVLNRGFGLEKTSVWQGAVVSLAWSFGLLLITILVLRIRGL